MITIALIFAALVLVVALIDLRFHREQHDYWHKQAQGWLDYAAKQTRAADELRRELECARYSDRIGKCPRYEKNPGAK